MGNLIRHTKWAIDDNDGYLTLFKDFGKVMQNNVESIALTKDGNFLYAGDECGCLIKIDLYLQSVCKKFGKIMYNISSIAITPDQKFLFVGGKKLIQFS